MPASGEPPARWHRNSATSSAGARRSPLRPATAGTLWRPRRLLQGARNVVPRTEAHSLVGAVSPEPGASRDFGSRSGRRRGRTGFDCDAGQRRHRLADRTGRGRSVGELSQKLSTRRRCESPSAAADRLAFQRRRRVRRPSSPPVPRRSRKKLSRGCRCWPIGPAWPAAPSGESSAGNSDRTAPGSRSFFRPGIAIWRACFASSVRRDVPAAAAALGESTRQSSRRLLHAGPDRVVRESAIRRRRVPDADFYVGGRRGRCRRPSKIGVSTRRSWPGTATASIRGLVGGRGLGFRAGAPRVPGPAVTRFKPAPRPGRHHARRERAPWRRWKR